jgi:hypothetical protein
LREFSEISIYNVFITNQFQITFAQREGREEENPLVEVTVYIKEENS